MLNHTLSNCYDHLRSSAFSSSADERRYLTFGVQFCVLILLTLLVICGNTLVILAVLCYKHLRGAGGLLIASLAGADLSVGLFVLPFSAVNQASGGVWPFGSVWCQMWLAIDVWMCTSSIYNLIAIAFDRFVAVTKPLSYR
uniref:G-protein coupled receptors family 1 profile domain-containing protein n=1 Tax=Romanomermis culicivorax TaxID=13658 RepID=A0A915KTB2_ROMCU